MRGAERDAELVRTRDGELVLTSVDARGALLERESHGVVTVALWLQQHPERVDAARLRVAVSVARVHRERERHTGWHALLPAVAVRHLAVPRHRRARVHRQRD